MRYLLLNSILITILAVSLPCRAKDFFPTNGAELQSALTEAASNNLDDTINLAAVTYRTSENGNQTFTYDSTEDHDLTVVGQGIGVSILDNEKINGNRVVKLVTTGNLASITVQGVTIQNGKNGPGDGTGLEIETDDGDIALLDSEVRDNSGSEVIGIDLDSLNGDVTMSNCQLTGNIGTSTTGNGISAHNNGTVTAEDNTVTGNTASTQAGLSIQTSDGNIIFNRNLVLDNHAGTNDTGGVRLTTAAGNMTFTNNIVAKNTAVAAKGGVFLNPQTGDVTVVNNTITENTAGTFGGGLFVTADTTNTTNIYNNIVFDNTATAGQGQDILIDDTLAPNPTVNLFNNDFSEFCFKTGGCNPGALGVNNGDNRNDDPLFVNAVANNFNLTASSPVIDQATGTVPGGLPSPDFAGNVRPQGKAPDMGALEFVPGGGGCQLSHAASTTSLSWSLFMGLMALAYLHQFRMNNP